MTNTVAEWRVAFIPTAKWMLFAVLMVSGPELLAASATQNPDDPETRPIPNRSQLTVHFEYDLENNPSARSDTRFIGATRLQASYVYDALNMFTSKSFNDATPGVTFTYDTDLAIPGETSTNASVGPMTKVSSGVTESIYRYDKLGRVTASQQKTDSTTYPFSYSYVPAGLSGMKYPSGRQLAMSYDAAGRLKEVTGYASGMTYKAGGLLKGMMLGNGVVEARGYNSRLQPDAITATAGGTSLLNITLFYGNGAATANNGNITGQTIVAGGKTFTHAYTYGDAVNRLTGASETSAGALGWSQGYGYDAYGNRGMTSNTLALEVWQPGGFDSNNRVSGWVYDAAGNLTNRGAAAISYDAENRMTSYAEGVRPDTSFTVQTGHILYSYQASKWAKWAVSDQSSGAHGAPRMTDSGAGNGARVASLRCSILRPAATD